MLWFQKKSPPQKAAADYLAEAERALLSQLVDPEDATTAAPHTVERMHRRLLALERLHEVQSRFSSKTAKRRFLETPAGVAVLTGSLTILASQAPAIVQLQESRVRAEMELLKPVVEYIVKDDSMDLDTRLSLVAAIQSGQTHYRTVAEIKAEAQRRKGTGNDAAATPLAPPASGPGGKP